MCKRNDYYIFSDVNRGPPLSKDSCFVEVTRFASQYRIIFELSLFFVSALLFVGMTSACVLCCCKREDEHEE